MRRDAEMADPEIQKADDSEKFQKYCTYLERRETLKSSRALCEMMEHESVGCNCFQYIAIECAPEMPRFTILQPDAKFNEDHENTVAGMFVTPAEPETAPIRRKRGMKYSTDYKGEFSNGKPRKPYAGGDRRKRGDQETRRVIKKKLFMDLGIIRTNCGIDVHNSATLECHLCLKRFDQTIHFNRHMKTHYGPNAQFDVQCELCDRKFKDKDSLKTHMEVSHQPKTLS
uniref:C2H2-type domain-containing protein n=1 Tax=Caenorhabditis japonica TaxID=281687 RepID=A0A8R1HQ84_CAEJA